MKRSSLAALLAVLLSIGAVSASACYGDDGGSTEQRDSDTGDRDY